MTAFSIGNGPPQSNPNALDPAGTRADVATRQSTLYDAAPLFVSDALIGIEHGDRLAEQADALAELLKSELQGKEEAERDLREAEAHEWIDPEALAELLAETLQKDEEIQRAREELVADLQQGSPETMQQMLRERCDNNPTQLFLALQQAAGALRRGAVASDDGSGDGAQPRAATARRRGGAGGEDAEAILERLQDMTQELELSHGTRIRADLNTRGVWHMPDTTRQWDAAEIVSLQASYTTLVEGDTRIASVLLRVLDGVDMLQAKDPGNIIDATPGAETRVGTTAQAVLERFIQAVGRDIEALRPSVDKEHLHALLTEKSHIITAVTVLQQCDTLAATLHPRSPSNADAVALQTMRKAVELTDQAYFAPEAFVQFARTIAAEADHRPVSTGSMGDAGHTSGVVTQSDAGVSPVIARAIPFLTGFGVVVRDMPEQVFVDALQRGRARDAVQHALDDLIDEENAGV